MAKKPRNTVARQIIADKISAIDAEISVLEAKKQIVRELLFALEAAQTTEIEEEEGQ